MCVHARLFKRRVCGMYERERVASGCLKSLHTIVFSWLSGFGWCSRVVTNLEENKESWLLVQNLKHSALRFKPLLRTLCHLIKCVYSNKLLLFLWKEMHHKPSCKASCVFTSCSFLDRWYKSMWLIIFYFFFFVRKRCSHCSFLAQCFVNLKSFLRNSEKTPSFY